MANYKNGAWDEGGLTADANVVISECAGILPVLSGGFEGLKVYETKDGSIVAFRPDQNAERMINSAKGMEMPPISKRTFPGCLRSGGKGKCGLGAALWKRRFSLYIGPYMFASHL